MAKPKFKRVVLKLSGEALLPKGEKYGVGLATTDLLAQEIKSIFDVGVDIGVVVGGGNIFRGLSEEASGMDRTTADHMGMLATVINSLAIQDSLERIGIHTRVLSAVEIKSVAEPYIRRRAARHLEKKRVIIFAGGTGNPYFSTDTAAALRSAEIRAEVLLKATKVDGVYDSDPFKNPSAKRFDSLSYMDCLKKRLKVMDATAISMCMDNNIPIIVFDFFKPGNLKKVVMGAEIGTVVYG